MCTKFLADETEKVDKYISGLPDNIHRNVMSARPKTLDEATELANDLMDQKLRTYAERQTESKRKFDNNNQAKEIPKTQNVAQAYAIRTGERKECARTLPLCNKCKFYHNGPCTTNKEFLKSLANDLMDQKLRTYAERQTENKRKFDNNNQAQQIPKRQNMAQAYAVGTGEKKEYAGTLPLCNNCKFHHNGPCTTKCANCMKNGNHGNQAEGTGARRMVYALEGGETNQDLDDIKDDINA
uniref:Reverse transcriptase domain-containing protein n=1 Tax=Tanacetum cinerariifolium TaxID=118510 RepID=A0A6L2L1V5_TANCI|nr:reverse transcriptase domain-containing protein [Tanacetum cinerariifolium]